MKIQQYKDTIKALMRSAASPRRGSGRLRLGHLSASLLGLALLASCSSGDAPDAPGDVPGVVEPQPEPQTEMILLSSRSSMVMEWEVTPMGSRAEGDPEPGSDKPHMPDDIGVYCYNDVIGLSDHGFHEVMRNVKMYYQPTNRAAAEAEGAIAPGEEWADGVNNWIYKNPQRWLVSTAERDVNYKFYAYAPYSDDVTAEEYSFWNFKRVIIPNVRRYSAVDYVVGQSLLEYVASPTGLNPYQTMQMSHLHSRLRFRFTVGEEYDELRYIRIKQLSVTNLQGQTFTVICTFQPDGSVTTRWNRNDTGGAYDRADLVMDVVTDDPTGATDYVELVKGEFKPFGSLYAYAGDGIGNLAITAVYDILDKEHQLLRKNDTATSVITLNLAAATAGGSNALHPGCTRNVNIVVNPTFLYVLSDNDMGIDGEVVIKP